MKISRAERAALGAAALLLAFLVFGRKEKDPMRQKDKERRRAARRAEKRHRQAQREGLGA